MHVDGDTTSVLANSGATTPPRRLMRAAQEFEAQMMKELLKPLSAYDGFLGDEADSGADGVLGEFASESLGRAFSERGGLGIATNIVHSLFHARSQHQSSVVTEHPHGNTLLRKLE